MTSSLLYCCVCNGGPWYDLKHLESHIGTTHLAWWPYMCRLCYAYSCTTDKELINHFQCAHPDAINPMVFCEYSSKDKRPLWLEHYLKKSLLASIDVYTSQDTAGQPSTTPVVSQVPCPVLKPQISKPRSQPKLRCQFCSEDVKMCIGSLRAHIWKHTSKPYSCSACKKEFDGWAPGAAAKHVIACKWKSPSAKVVDKRSELKESYNRYKELCFPGSLML